MLLLMSGFGYKQNVPVISKIINIKLLLLMLLI